MSFNIIVGSYTNDLVTLTFDPAARSLAKTSSIHVGYRPSWVTAHPEDTSLVFTCLEQGDGAVHALKYDATGKGTIVATMASGGGWPCAMHATKNELFIANYGTGHVSVLPISSEAPYFLSAEATALAQFTGKGPHERQTSSHPHQIYFVEGREEFIVPDLGGDRVYRFKKDANTGTWVVADEIEHAAGAGSRHAAFYNGILYTIQELENRLLAHRLPQLPAKPTLISNDATLTTPAKDMLAGAIFIPKPNARFPVPYIYVSNREEGHPEGDLVTIFAIQEGGAPKIVSEIRTGTKHPRGMAFGGEDEKYLIIGGQFGGGVKVYERVDGGKNLKLVASSPEELEPTDFCWI